MQFEDFKLDSRILEGISFMGFKNPSPIQEQSIPIILEKSDLVACAQTGTGKTAAYLLPVIHHILKCENGNMLKALIVAPTRELAQQIDQQMDGFSYFTGISSIAVYGGNDGLSFEREKKALIEGANIIIATPGRLSSHIKMEYVDFSTLEYFVLDEADRMLDMGFYDDIMAIERCLPKNRQTLLFSATMPNRIREMANKILREPKQVNIAISKPAEGIVQAAYLVYDQQKIALIKELLGDKKLESILIFSSTKSNVKKIEHTLKTNGLPAKAIHSDLEQAEREQVMLEFRNRNLRILVATDIVSRGIDVAGIELVINYDVPEDAEDYVHRIGRTARADKTGIGITFINEKDQQKFHRIEQLIGNAVHKLPLPPSLGKGPAYDPKAKPPPSFHKNRRSGKPFRQNRPGAHR